MKFIFFKWAVVRSALTLPTTLLRANLSFVSRFFRVDYKITKFAIISTYKEENFIIFFQYFFLQFYRVIHNVFWRLNAILTKVLCIYLKKA